MNSSISSGKDDEMHIKARGADTFASMVAQLLLQSESKLKHYLKKNQILWFADLKKHFRSHKFEIL